MSSYKSYAYDEYEIKGLLLVIIIITNTTIT